MRWGFQWGALNRWGDGSLTYTSTTQGVESNAKDDTLYYARDDGGGISDLAVDLSQYGDNQTAAATWTYESSPASRFNVTSRWTVEAEIEVDNADTGRIMLYGTTAANSVISMRYGNSAGVLDVIMATGGVASSIGSLTLPNVSGSLQRFVVAWAVEPNLATTGATNALRSELRAWNITAGTYAQAVFTHRDRASGTSDFVWWASSSGGANAFTGVPYACRFSAGRFKTATETHEDFVVRTTAPTVTGKSRVEFSIVQPGHALEAAGAFAGPVHAMGASSVNSMGLRLMSPIVNEVYLQRQTMTGDDLGGLDTSQFAREAPDTAYTMLALYTFYRPVPAIADRLRCAVEAQQWRTSGVTSDRLHFRIYSMNRPPLPVADVVDLDAAFRSFYAEGTLAAEHGSGASAGEWVDCGLTRIAKNSDGCTWLALAIYVEDLSGDVAGTSFEIGAITVEPVMSTDS